MCTRQINHVKNDSVRARSWLKAQKSDYSPRRCKVYRILLLTNNLVSFYHHVIQLGFAFDLQGTIASSNAAG